MNKDKIAAYIEVQEAIEAFCLRIANPPNPTIIEREMILGMTTVLAAFSSKTIGAMIKKEIKS